MRVNGLNVEPPWARSWVTALRDCSTKSGPPYSATIRPVSGSMETRPTRLFSGRSSGRLSTAATAASCRGFSMVVTTVRPAVFSSASSIPASSTSSVRTMSRRYPVGPAKVSARVGSMVAGKVWASRSSWVIHSSSTIRSSTRFHRCSAVARSTAGS